MNIKRGHIIIAIIIALAFIAVLLLLSRGRTGALELTAPRNTPGNQAVDVRILEEDQDTKTITLQPGETKKVRVDPGRVRVDGSAGTLKAIDVVTIKTLSTTKLETPSGEQRSVQQLASDAKYCPAIIKGVTYSYSCDDEGPIIKHEANTLGGSLNSALFDGTSFAYLKPFKQGFIGFYAAAGSGATNLLYIDPAAGATQIVDLPDEIQQQLVNNVPDITTTSDPQGSRFILTFRQTNRVYLFDDTTDATPKQLKPEREVRLNEEGRIGRTSFFGTNPVVFYGSSNDIREGEEGGDTADNEDIPPAYLFEYSDNGTLQKTIDLPEDLEAQGVYKLSDTFYVADQSYGFGFFRLDGDKLEHVYTLQDMGSWTINQGKVYAESNGTLFEFNPGKGDTFKLRSLYGLLDITVSELYSGPQGILFTGFTDTGSNAPLNVYRLLHKGEKASIAAGINSQTVEWAVEPVYAGIDELVDQGLSAFQEANLRFVLSKYTATLSPLPATVSITNVEAAPRDPNDPEPKDILGFDITLGETQLKGRVDYSSLTAIRLTLSDPQSSRVVYDSGVVNHKEPLDYNPEPQH